MKLQIAGNGGSCKQTNKTHADEVLWYGSYTQLFHLPLKFVRNMSRNVPRANLCYLLGCYAGN